MNNDDAIVKLIIDGLCTDGGHHKQYFLEEVLKKIVGDMYPEIKKTFDWDDGTPS